MSCAWLKFDTSAIA